MNNYKAVFFSSITLLCSCLDGERTQPTNSDNNKTKNTMTATLKTPLISAEELLDLKEKEDLVLVDARFSKTVHEDYQKEHLKGAVHVDLNAQLSNIGANAAKGGRHPLPSVAQFGALLTELGITKDSHVVIYDTETGAMAASRFWWMLKAAGHEKVQVLNGGLKHALRVGYPTKSGRESRPKVPPYVFDAWQLPITTLAKVEQEVQNAKYLVIDARAADRYSGKVEPIDLVAGHIPGAVNYHFEQNLDENGLFKSPEALKKSYETLLDGVPTSNVTMHCGSGVTACHNLLAMAHAGLEIPKLYVGSWSEWSRNNKPIATDN